MVTVVAYYVITSDQVAVIPMACIYAVMSLWVSIYMSATIEL